jgi:triosephosphate isomerase
MEANRIIGLIRSILATHDNAASAYTRILYGGSVTADNVAEFSQQPEIDGALVGGASLDARKFLAIISGFARRTLA